MENLLNHDQGNVLLAFARATLQHKLVGGKEPKPPDDPAFSSLSATFVTLKIGDMLRGCIGNLQPVGTLWEGIRANAINAAFHDHRFSALKPEELEKVHLDISILSPPQPLTYTSPEALLAQLRPGVDGVILGDGRRSATFLPQVWQQLPNPQQFLGHLCQKAGLSETAWRDQKLVIHLYQVQCFAEENR